MCADDEDEDDRNGDDVVDDGDDNGCNPWARWYSLGQESSILWSCHPLMCYCWEVDRVEWVVYISWFHFTTAATLPLQNKLLHLFFHIGCSFHSFLVILEFQFQSTRMIILSKQHFIKCKNVTGSHPSATFNWQEVGGL